MIYELGEAYVNCVYGHVWGPHILQGLSSWTLVYNNDILFHYKDFHVRYACIEDHIQNHTILNIGVKIKKNDMFSMPMSLACEIRLR